jgi:low temperature requirement protein LtrA
MVEDRSASFVELFFDLVFVFGITQIVASIHGHLDWPTLWRAAVVLMLLWWLWSQFTWLAGHVDFDDIGPRVVMLVSTAGTFLLATAVQGAWGEDGALFGIGYFGVMLLAGVFYWIRAVAAGETGGAVAYIPRVAAGALLVLIGGFVDGDARSWFWIAGVVVTLLGAAAAGEHTFTINDSHFAERHGLFVIIVLGEALIAIGISTLGQEGSAEFYVGGTAALLTVLAMWWAYFDWPYPVGEHALKEAGGVEESTLARDAYTLGHYPLIAGVILFAVGMEELLAHPGDAVPDPSRWAIVGGLALFVLSIAFSAWRLKGKVTWERVVVAGLLGLAAIVFEELAGGWLALIVVSLLVAALTMESVRHRPELAALRAESGEKRQAGSSAS